MVERIKAETFDTFTGKVETVELVDDNMKEGLKQYHLVIEPIDVEVKGKTGRLHEWLRLTEKCTDTTVVEGCVLDRYIAELELFDKELKDLESHAQVMSWMEGKKFRFVKRKLGKSHGGYDAKDYWTPNTLL